VSGEGCFALELCRSCGGTGVLGQAGGYRIICEDCCDSLLEWVERCCQPSGDEQ
jgi:hypothetical protein